MLLGPAWPVQLAEDLTQRGCYLDIPWLPFVKLYCTVVFSNRLSAEASVDGLVPWRRRLRQDLGPLPRSGHDTSFARAF
jgi:hypothetical protein